MAGDTEAWAPENAAEVAGCVRDAIEQGMTLELVGTASRRGLGRPVEADVVLDLSAISGIVTYEPEELVLVVRPGTALADIESSLADKRQYLAFEPPCFAALWGSRGSGTIGGTIMTGRSGPRRLTAGGARDYVLGVKGVNGFGDQFAAGGRVVKNVTGFDVAKLVTGSFGTLCALTELTLKVLPRPVATRTLALFGLGDDAALTALRRVIAATTGSISGAAHLPKAVAGSSANAAITDPESAVTLLRFEGFEPAVSAHFALAMGIARDVAPCTELDNAIADSLWAEIRDAAFFNGGDAPVWRVSVPPKAGALTGLRLVNELGGRCYYDLAGGAVCLELPNAPDAHGRELRRVLESVSAGDGHATLLRAASDVRAIACPFHPLEQPVAELTRRVQQQFDPAGIFNPGRMYEAA